MKDSQHKQKSQTKETKQIKPNRHKNNRPKSLKAEIKSERRSKSVLKGQKSDPRAWLPKAMLNIENSVAEDSRARLIKGEKQRSASEATFRKDHASRSLERLRVEESQVREKLRELRQL
jgi:hypothetical protein